MSFTDGEPNWSLLQLDPHEKMPAIQWKLINIRHLRARNPNKHAEQLLKLETVLNRQDR
jgi:hypothetical protein